MITEKVKLKHRTKIQSIFPRQSINTPKYISHKFLSKLIKAPKEQMQMFEKEYNRIASKIEKANKETKAENKKRKQLKEQEKEREKLKSTSSENDNSTLSNSNNNNCGSSISRSSSTEKRRQIQPVPNKFEFLLKVEFEFKLIGVSWTEFSVT